VTNNESQPVASKAVARGDLPRGDEADIVLSFRELIHANKSAEKACESHSSLHPVFHSDVLSWLEP
jgi:hypothetical protein